MSRHPVRTSSVPEPQSTPAPSAAPAPAVNVIEVENLSTHYGDQQVLHDVDLQVRAGEIMVIMGGSGSGKTTLMRQLIGLERPTRGTIRLFGEDLATIGARDLQKIRRKLGVAFQGGALFSSMTVAQNIMLPLREHTDLDRKTMEIMARLKLEIVDLAGVGDKMPAELSGGMLKRAAVARAIVMDPSLLFFDEPSAGLDPVTSAAIDQLILLLRTAMNMTIVVVTHELESAFAIADRITVLDHGRILSIDTVEGLRNNPDQRIRNLLNRRTEQVEPDADQYIRRLTGEAG